MEETLTLSDCLFEYKLDEFQDSIMKSNQVAEIIAKDKSQRPFHLNVIEAACQGRFKETGHSLVLADMLKDHRIRDSFLDTFLGIKLGDNGVKVETELPIKKDRRIDIALIKEKEKFVIIENKVNNAGERQSQIYDYVHGVIEKYELQMSQIYVVYLNSLNSSRPSDYSLCDENNENNVFDDLGEDHHRVISYKYNITKWLRKIKIDNEPHISSALDQYIDFLEQKFHTSPLDKEMNNEIKNFLFEELQIKGKSFEEQMTALNNQYNKVDELLNAINKLRVELMREWQKQVEQRLGIKLAYDDHSFGIQLNNKVWMGIWDGHDFEENVPYWGFQFTSFSKENMPELSNEIYNLLNSVDITDYEVEKGWVAWCSTQKGADDFISLYNAAKKNGLLG